MADNPNYLELALNTFNKDFHQWYGYEDITLGDGTATENGYSVYSNVISHYEDAVIPTEEEVNQKIAELQWEKNRRDNYPALAEQFDKLWHDINNGTLDNTGEFFTALKNVKDTYPKENE